LDGVGGVPRLAQHHAANDHYGVGSQNDFSGAGGDGHSFIARQARHVVSRVLVRSRRFVYVGRPDYERDAGLSQDLAAARRTGCEHQHAFMLAVMLAV
jgi:hypothetical protein